MAKVAVVTFGESSKNGGNATLLDLIDALKHSEHRVHLYTPLGRFSRHIYRNSLLSSGLRRFFFPLICSNLKDVPYSGLKRIILFCASCLGIFSMLRFRHYDYIVDGIGINPYFLRYLKKRGVWVVRNHAGDPEAFYNFFLSSRSLPLPDRSLYYVEYMQNYATLLFQDASHAKKSRQLFSEFNSETLPAFWVVRPSVSRLVHNYEASNRQESGTKVKLLAIGSIQSRKGLHIAVKFLAYLRGSGVDAQLCAIGNIIDDEYFASIMDEVRASKIEEYFTFKGFQSDYRDELAGADYLLLFSQAEGVPRVVRESLALDTPILGYEFASVSRDISEKNGGFFVESSAAKTVNFNELKRVILSETFDGRRAYEAIFSYESYVEDISKLFAQ